MLVPLLQTKGLAKLTWSALFRVDDNTQCTLIALQKKCYVSVADANAYAAVRAIVRSISIAVSVAWSVSVIRSTAIAAVGDAVADRCDIGTVGCDRCDVGTVGCDRCGVDNRSDWCPVNNGGGCGVRRVSYGAGAALCRCVLTHDRWSDCQGDGQQKLVEHEPVLRVEEFRTPNVMKETAVVRDGLSSLSHRFPPSEVGGQHAKVAKRVQWVDSCLCETQADTRVAAGGRRGTPSFVRKRASFHSFRVGFEKWPDETTS